MHLHIHSISTSAVDWLNNSKTIHIHSLFKTACNFINQHNTLFSIVTPSVGLAPFSAVLTQEHNLADLLSTAAFTSLTPNQITIGTLTLDFSHAAPWSPRPAWHTLTAEAIHHQHPLLRTLLTPHPHLTTHLFHFPHITAAAHHLAGRGTGLTPAGDDFLLGIIFALWSHLPPAQAQHIAHHIAQIAAPRTTTFSAAWLHAAARGEAHITWHHLANALHNDDPAAVRTAANHILHFGHTSGADALSGFLTTAKALLTKHPPPSFWQIHN